MDWVIKIPKLINFITQDKEYTHWLYCTCYNASEFQGQTKQGKEVDKGPGISYIPQLLSQVVHEPAWIAWNNLKSFPQSGFEPGTSVAAVNAASSTRPAISG
jgi:hypothetical protein